MEMILSLNKDFCWPPIIGAYGAVCIRDAIQHMLETEKICAVSKSGEKPAFGEIPRGLYRDLLKFFPPIIMHFERIAHPEFRTKIPPPSVGVLESAIRFGKIIGRVNPRIGLLREASNGQTASAREIVVWCSKAHALLEHIPPEKRLAYGENLMPWEKDFLPELAKFFEIFHRQEETSAQAYL
ncbi:MAG: hypothetical protein HZC04_00765 [Candidatus Lloydbacteria bacterium]|nr:hypothetical protein [Candidatus Lloydbacteria bacterium]